MFCAYPRPRYQVSVYRTIDPQVYLFIIILIVNPLDGEHGKNIYV